MPISGPSGFVHLVHMGPNNVAGLQNLIELHNTNNSNNPNTNTSNTSTITSNNASSGSNFIQQHSTSSSGIQEKVIFNLLNYNILYMYLNTKRI